mgnify:CR=1 FL=1
MNNELSYNKTFEELMDNIEILDVSMTAELFCQAKVSLKIRDNNKKIFKNKKIKWLTEILDDGEELHYAIQRHIESYIRNEYGVLLAKVSIENPLKQYKKQYLEDKE